MVFCESGNDSLIMEGSPGLDGDLQGFHNNFSKILGMVCAKRR
jgi:hypothetical protein